MKKPGDRVLHPRRGRPWQISLPRPPGIRGRQATPLTLVYGFAGIILVGCLLLMLPVSSATGRTTSFIDALFTATSAVCVTGLVVVDTGTYWSPFGHGVLLALFQIGGFGFMISATLILLVMGRRIGLRERMLLGQSVGLERLGGLVRLVRRVAIFTGIAEGLGALILFFSFWYHGTPAGVSIWWAIFHSISAFNNCGMDLFGNFQSLLNYQTDAATVLTMAGLIIFGGIGYIVVEDLLRNRSLHRLTADSKIVLTATLVLLSAGTVFILLVEFSNQATLGPLSFLNKLSVAFFQSVTRTAGFSTIDVGKMLPVSLFFTMFLMFVGGASGSTAGGIKVNTLGVLVAAAVSTIRGQENTEAFGREITSQNISRALSLVMVFLGLAAVVVVILSITERFDFVKVLFETFSALGTVGLTTGITPGLSTAGRILITVTMFLGRLGPLTLTSVLIERRRPTVFRFPKEIVRIG